MNILVIARGIPSNKYKMQGIFEFDQAIALSKNNKVVYLSFDIRSIRRWRRWGIHRYKNRNIDIIEVNLPLGQFPDVLIDKLAIFKLRQILKNTIDKYRIDIIHAHFIENGYYLVKAIENIDIPTILTEHRSDMNKKYLSNRFKYLGEHTYNNVNRVVSVSNALAMAIYSNFNVESEVIPNIVDLENFSFNKYSSRTSNIVSVGNLCKGKNFKLLIEAFSNAYHDERKLIIIGDGEEKEMLKKQAELLGISDRIVFYGVLSRGEIGKIMDECSFFALASNSETFGVAYIEALAKGLPVVATKCGGPEDFVNKNNGIIVPCNNSKELTIALKTMDKDIELYNREQISLEVYEKFSADHVAEILENLYCRIINNVS